jgi:hypothetical protein
MQLGLGVTGVSEGLSAMSVSSSLTGDLVAERPSWKISDLDLLFRQNYSSTGDDGRQA